jgi:hypothetical protein
VLRISRVTERLLAPQEGITSFEHFFVGGEKSTFGTPATTGLTVPASDDKYQLLRVMRSGRGNRSTRRKPALVPLCAPQIPHDLGSNGRRREGKPETNSKGTGRTGILRFP